MQLCDAMYHRKTSTLQNLLDNYPVNPIKSVNMSIEYGHKICSQLLSLGRYGVGVTHTAISSSDIYKLEEYLLQCAIVGSQDEDEISNVIDLRSKLVKKALDENQNQEYSGIASNRRASAKSGKKGAEKNPATSSSFYPEFLALKQRAMLTNVMISRDVVGMRSTLKSVIPKAGGDNSIMRTCLSEYTACKKLYNDIINATTKLQNLVDAATAHMTTVQTLVQQEAHKQNNLNRTGNLLNKDKKKTSATPVLVTLSNNIPPISLYPVPLNSANIQPILTCLQLLMDLVDAYTIASYFGIENKALMKQAQQLIVIYGKHPKYLTACIIVGLKEKNMDLISLGEKYMLTCEWSHVAFTSFIPKKLLHVMKEAALVSYFVLSVICLIILFITVFLVGGSSSSASY